MFNLFELLRNFFIGKNKEEELPIVPIVEIQQVVSEKKTRKLRKKKSEK